MPESTTHDSAVIDPTEPDSSGFTRAATLHEDTASRFDLAFTATTGHCPWAKAYGGDLVVQASVAAMRSVSADKSLHSIHSYFLRPADVASDVHWEVELLRDGRGYSARQVRGYQHDKPIFVALASFSVAEAGESMLVDAPGGIADPETLPSSADYLGSHASSAITPEARDYWMYGRSFDIRHHPGPLYLSVDGARVPHQAVWVKPFSPLAPVAGLTEAQRDRAALTYVCDYTILEPALRAVGVGWSNPSLATASLDHAMWFHREPSTSTALNDWVLYAQEALAVDGGRGSSIGRFFERDGRHLATVVQEGLIRTSTPETRRPAR